MKRFLLKCQISDVFMNVYTVKWFIYATDVSVKFPVTGRKVISHGDNLGATDESNFNAERYRIA